MEVKRKKQHLDGIERKKIGILRQERKHMGTGPIIIPISYSEVSHRFFLYESNPLKPIYFSYNPK
jgi:hypothetical protein